MNSVFVYSNKRSMPMLQLLSAIAFAGLGSLSSAEPVEDNSFLVEEAYNQEPGVVQFIQSFQKNRLGRDWDYLFVNEIPVPNETHQFSYEIPVANRSAVEKTKIADVKLNYRQEFLHNETFVATGRLSATLPTGDYKNDFGAGAPGYELSLITSMTLNKKWVQHWNVGMGMTPGAKNSSDEKADLQSYFFGVSNVYLFTDSLNFMLEVVGRVESEVVGPKTAAFTDSFTISPSVRYGIDVADWQIVPGFAIPTDVKGDHQESGFLAYLSVEGKLW